MKMLPDFLFCENKSALPGAGLILYTKPPYLVGQVIKFASRSEMDAWITQHQPTAIGKPYDYTIVIVFAGSLAAYQLPTTQDGADALANVFRQMSDFYLDEKIKPNERYFERYRDK